jgi:integrase
MCSKNSEINKLKGWTPPVFHQASECYVSFTAFCPETGKMKLKKIMLGRIKSKRLQREKARQIMQHLTEKLLDGWNPWIEAVSPTEYTLWDDVVLKYEQWLAKMAKENGYRMETVASYMSYMKVLKDWIADKNVHYIYQFDRRVVGKFLDYVFVERNNTLQTRNNYLAWIKTFAKYLVQRSYVPKNPTEGFQMVMRSARFKNRDTIDERNLQRLKEYLEKNNRHYLLATYILYYTFLRPREMSLLKIEDINIKKQLILVHGDNAKNHVDAAVTLPKKILLLMVELGVFNSPGSYYLFSNDFKPGAEYRSEKSFRDYWLHHVRRDLKFPERYKFYSLKDTGITNMLRQHVDTVSVRDQARHSSIDITNIYVPHDMKRANATLKDYDGDF